MADTKRAPRSKVFCIGQNKTGTTSLAEALTQLGFTLGDQPTAELLLDDWSRRDFRALVRYCASADAFQDIPFSLDYTYQALDAAFPGAKFILTVRDSAAQWYSSLTRFHTKLVGKDRLPTADDLKAFPYCRPGWLWDAVRLVYGESEDALYHRDTYMRRYDEQNRRAVEYFRHRPGDLLVLNVGHPDAMRHLVTFLGVGDPRGSMPHLNQT